jgi:alkyl hydroperoxide reductase subunit F
VRLNAVVTGLFLLVELASLSAVTWLGFSHAHRSLTEALRPVMLTGGHVTPVTLAGLGIGAAAAIYAARKGIRTGLLAERFGGQLMDTLGIENFISMKATDGPKLVMGLEEHVRDYEVDVMNLQRAAALIPGELIEVKLQNGASLRSRSVILATGARWREMNVPGEQEYRGKGVAYCPHCDGPLFKGKRVAVIGGGNSGVEAAIDLAGVVAHVTLLEFDGQLRADAVLQRKLFSLPNVTVLTKAQSTLVTGDGSKVNGLQYKDRVSGESKHLALEGIFVQIGLLPNTDWLKATVALSGRGEIEIDARGATSVPGVFAAGDCTTVPYKQIIIAMGAGATASLSAFDHLIRSSVESNQTAQSAQAALTPLAASAWRSRSGKPCWLARNQARAEVPSAWRCAPSSTSTCPTAASSAASSNA